MIQFEKFTLANGLRVIVHEDKSTPMAVMNVVYDVGARDENETRTGFAHLFEHLMFGGSVNIPSYDEPLQIAGGENNAFTTNDFTVYHCQLPSENIETAFWLESDRMLSLAFTEKSLEVQRKVVCEEFKESYINKPYGDVWHKIREMAYTTHPYKWMTIGKELGHIEKVKLKEVKDFFFKHYTPCNAIVVVAGNVEKARIKELAEKWFGPIPSGNKYNRHLPVEPTQTKARSLEVRADVPLDSIYKCWHIYPRMDRRYYIVDLITEILSGGASSRLYQSLVKEKKLFSDINCFHFGSTDAGLLTVEGKLVKGVPMQQAGEAIMNEIHILQQHGVSENELQKVKNKTESLLLFEDMSVANRATSLGIYELLGNIDLINTELENYNSVTRDEIIRESNIIFSDSNCNTLYYYSNN